MTFTINATVKEVILIEQGDKKVNHIRLVATAGQKVIGYTSVEQDAIYSNTEGVIEHVKIDLFIEGSESQLFKGDVVTFHGNFKAPMKE